MRKDYGKLTTGGIEHAPDTLIDNGNYIVAPQPADYTRLGWLPVTDTPPATPPREGYHWEGAWAVQDGRIVRQYAEVADPPTPPRTFRRSYLAQWIRGAGKWGAFAAFLADPAAADLAFLWEYCTEFDEDNEAWPGAVIAIKEALDLTDAEAEAMLEFGATGGQP